MEMSENAPVILGDELTTISKDVGYWDSGTAKCL